jgi:mannitol operon transcriptional antiterminator
MAIVYNLDVRCYEILKYLLYQDGYTTVKQLADEKKISKRSVYYDIRKINEWLEAQELLPLEIERKKGIWIEKEQKKQIHTKLKMMPSELAYVFTPVERTKIIICSVLQRSRNLFLDDFMELCQVSRNTIINDIKEATKIISEYQLQLIYENGKGYHIVGDLVRKRSIYFAFFNSIADFYKKEILPLDDPKKVQLILDNLKDIEDALDVQYVQGTLYTVAVFFSTIDNRSDILEFSESEKSEIIHTKEYEMVTERFHDLNESEQLYLALHLLGSRIQSIPVNFMNEKTGQETQRLSRILVKAFSRIAGIGFSKEDELVQAIAAHLKTSLYRYRYGVQLANPMLDNIKNEYGDLFEITSRACKYLEKEIGVPIPEGEVAYITLHFGAFITSGQQKEQELRVLIVCPNGLSTANMIRGEIQTLVPNAQTVDIRSLKDYQKQHDYNVVISTIVIEDENNLILVHPILTDNDRIAVLKKCMKYEHKNSINITQIAEIASKYMTEDNLQEFKEELLEIFSKTSLKTYVKKGNLYKGIREMLEEPYIQIEEDHYSWEEAVCVSGRKMMEEGFIEQSYIDSIIQKTKQYGPYMFITNHVFLAHSEIEDGAKKMGIALSVFKDPVEFTALDGKKRYAKIILTLSAENQKTHIKLLNDIMTIFAESENEEKIWNAKTPANIKEIICKLL